MAGTQRIVEIPYSPRRVFMPFHTRQQRWACMVAHRRAGKTVACINELVRGALTCKMAEPRVAYIGPYYAQAKDVAWSYLQHYTACIPHMDANQSELRVDLPNKGRVRLYGADNYNRLRGIYLDGVVLDEYADMDPRAWSEVIRPALSDRQGWAVFIGTPKGRNGFWDVMQAAKADPELWYSATLRASETGLVPAAELADAQRMMTPEQYAQEYECSFEAAIIGAYYGQEIAQLEAQKRIRVVPHEPTLPVHTAWDLGLDDATAIWFAQVAGGEVRLIDYAEYKDTALVEIARSLRNDKPYTWGEHYLPHDADVRELTSGKSRRDTLESLGLRPIRIAPREDVAEGIHHVRVLLPKCVIDEQRCARGIEALRQYRREWDDKTKTYHQRPRHDWASHAADALRYLALCLKAAPASMSQHRRPPRRYIV